MTNFRMTKDEGMTKPEARKALAAVLRHSCFVIVSSFVIRHSAF